MTPAFTNTTNAVYTLPGCGALPTTRTDGAVHSFWKPTPEELEALAAGALILLTMAGTAVPPTSLVVFVPSGEFQEVETPAEFLIPAEEPKLIVEG